LKTIVFLKGSLSAIRAFPEAVRREAGFQLDRLQHGLDPIDWKPMRAIGPGVREIRIRDQGQFRVIYIGDFRGRVAVLHAFHKKTRKTRKADIEAGRQAFRDLHRNRK
jgi:phage-related protein